MGSLYTSICPSLCLEGVGEHVAARSVPKVMLLNGGHDRETASSGVHDGPMTAADMVQAVCDALNRRRSRHSHRLRNPVSSYVTTLLVPRGCSIEVNMQQLLWMGVSQVLEVDADIDESGQRMYDALAMVEALKQVIIAPQQSAAAHLDKGAVGESGQMSAVN